MALWQTLRQKFMNFWSFLTRQAMNMTKRSAVACVGTHPLKEGSSCSVHWLQSKLGWFYQYYWQTKVKGERCNQMMHPYKFYTFYRDQSHWIVEAWVVFLHFFLVPLCWSAVSERQMLLTFCGRFSWSGQTSLNFKWFLWLLPWLYHWIIYSFYYSPMSMLFQKKQLNTV